MILTGVGLSAIALASLAKDPVVMTVNGIDVPRSEFEYLYHKNSRQQLEPQTLEDYVEMFKIYKLKVADAKACGIDTTSRFLREMRQYRKELSSPYLSDSLFFKQLVAEEIKRSAEEVEAYHIMVAKTSDSAKNRENRDKLDSLRNLLLNGADFGELAEKYSADGSAKTNKGYLGYISALRYPYNFETAAYQTPEGEISEIVESPVGYHILKGGKHRASSGKVRATHILKLVPKDASEEENAGLESLIDSVYNVVVADPAKFATLASSLSDDKGSARQGGELPVFGRGEMVPEFEAVAYSLDPGEISKPFRTAYGWHIVKKLENVAVSDEDIRNIVMNQAVNPRGDIYRVILEERNRKLASKHNAEINGKLLASMISLKDKNGMGEVIATYGSLPGSKENIVTVDGVGVPVGDYVKTLAKPDGMPANVDLEKSVAAFFASRLVEAEEDWLYENNNDYRNLLNEYHDGSLLYEISLQKVWDRAAKDTGGLTDYFEKHRSDYSWTSPKVKGYLVQTTTDSVADLIRTRIDGLPGDSIIPVVRKEFQGSAKIGRVLASRGENPMVDNIMFGDPEVVPKSSRYTSYFLYDPKILDQPTGIEDVKGLVVADYQNVLESEWISELKKRYPVKVNFREIKKVK